MGYQRDLETTVHMRLYGVKKTRVLFYIIIFITIIFLSGLIGFLGPSVISRNTYYASELMPVDRDLYNGFYKVTSNPVMLFQKEIWFSAVIHQTRKDAGYLSIPLSVIISVMCRASPESSSTDGNLDPASGEIVSIDRYQANLTLFCTNGKVCSELPLVHLSQLKCAAYTFKVQFLGLVSPEDQGTTLTRKRRHVREADYLDDSDAREDFSQRVADALREVSGRHRHTTSRKSHRNDEDNNDYQVDVSADSSVENEVDDDNDTSQQEEDEPPSKTTSTTAKLTEEPITTTRGQPDAAEALRNKAKEFEEESRVHPIPALEIEEIEFIIQTRNSSFGYFEMLSRFVAVLAAFALLLGFCKSMIVFEWRHWTAEQQWTLAILLLLPLYYDPLHPLVYLLPGWIPQALDNFFQISYYAFLLLFWLCVFDALRVADRSCACFYCPRLLLTTTIWLLFISFNGWVIHSEHRSPLFNIIHHPVIIKVFMVLLGVLAFIYLLFAFILLIRSYADLNAMPYYGIRLTVLIIPIILVVTNFLVTIALRFGPSGALYFLRPPTTDILIGSNTSMPVTPSGVAFPNYRSALELSLTFGIVFSFNLLMAIAYSPAKTALSEANFKDDPSISLAYDSDEDIVYGSDPSDIQLMRSLRDR